MKTSMNKAKLNADLSHSSPHSSSELGITMICYFLLNLSLYQLQKPTETI